MNKTVHVGEKDEQKGKWSGVYVRAKVKREKKSVGHVGNGERALETTAQATVSLSVLSEFPTFSISLSQNPLKEKLIEG